MSVEHMVWFRFKAEMPQPRINDLMTQLRALQKVIPGISSIRTGKNFTDRAQGHTHGLVVILDSPEALADYGPHPDHQKIVVQLKETCDSILAMDFEFDD
jgi:hypothetical protein